jgi:hypothetical protein
VGCIRENFAGVQFSKPICFQRDDLGTIASFAVKYLCLSLDPPRNRSIVGSRRNDMTLKDIQAMTTMDQIMGLSYLALSSQCLDEHETKLLCEFDPGLNKPIELMLDVDGVTCYDLEDEEFSTEE